MTLDEVVQIMREHLATKFPKACQTCGCTYLTLKDYLQRTRHVGQPIAFDVELDNMRLSNSLGSMSLANCACGSTLSLDSDGMSPLLLTKLMWWLVAEMARRGKTASEVLADVRRAVDEATLSEPTR